MQIFSLMLVKPVVHQLYSFQYISLKTLQFITLNSLIILDDLGALKAINYIVSKRNRRLAVSSYLQREIQT